MSYLLAGGCRVRAHPAADVFPLLSKDEITALAADIRTNGQRLPVLLQQADDGAGLVLDGRNRLLACEEAGLEPRVAYVEPTANAVQVIVSMNLARRHQGQSQRAMSAARLVNLCGRTQRIASIDAISQGTAAGLLHLGRATVQRAVAILDDPLLAPAVDAGRVSVSDAYAIRHAPEEAKRRALAAVADDSARTLRGALEREAAGSATVGWGSTAPAADRATGRSEPNRGVGDAKTVMASEAPTPSDGGSGSATEREVVETSTAGATDPEAHRPVASEPGGTEGEDAAGGWTSSESASSSDSGSSGSTPTAVRDRELGGADASPDPAPLLPAAVAGREAADVHAQGVGVATARSAGDADAERRRSTAGSTDSGASDGSEPTDAAGGRTRSSASSSHSGPSGAPTATPGRERGQQPAGPAGRVGGADVSPDSAPLLPARSAVGGREAAAAHAQGVHAATAAQTASDADAERRRCLSALRSSAVRLGAVSRVGTPSHFEAACCLVQDLVVAMERCLEADLDEQALVAGLPADLFRSLQARLGIEIGHGSTSTQDGGDAAGRGRGSAFLEQASDPRAWLKRFSLNRSRQPRAATAALFVLAGAADR